MPQAIERLLAIPATRARFPSRIGMARFYRHGTRQLLLFAGFLARYFREYWRQDAGASYRDVFMRLPEVTGKKAGASER